MCCTADSAALTALWLALGKVADLAGGPRRDTDLAVCKRGDGGCTDPEPSSGRQVWTGVRARGAFSTGVIGL